ncbi:hypothetical protein CcaverHIS002_0203370 [Cutaneotrichosporon cavernicola]|nr:hypothetical protein CcaverHIS002_0203370 [Cutaneotrichosporon cavernicola]
MTAASSALPGPLQSPTPASIESLLEGADDARAHLILGHALQYAVSRADVELVGWLSALDGRWSDILNDEVSTLEDADGWGVVGMAIQSSCGQSEKEEIVRLVVGRWGVVAGPRDGRDRHGWTPLHLAALLSSPQTVSVLLNRGASLSAVNDAGFTPFDLVTGMDGRENLALLLDPWAGGTPRTPSSPQSSSDDASQIAPERRAQIQRRRMRVATCVANARRREEEAGVAAERERWVRERAKHIGVDATVLYSQDHVKEEEGEEEEEEEEEDDDEMEVDEALGGLSSDVRAKVDMDASLLVFSLHQLPVLFDVFITSYRPVCKPRARRALPANALFLYARFAHYRCDAAWLEELLWGAVEAIEGVVYGKSEDLASLAFWEYNITLLLYLLRSDADLAEACADADLLVNFEELINAIHVFIIRIAERKIDEILEPAMLDFEALEDFDGVRFADEWNIFRSFGRKNKDKRETPLAAAVFSPPATTSKRGDGAESPLGTPRSRPTSIQDLRATVVAAKAEAKEVIANGIGKAQAVLGDKPSPRKVADILTSVLLVLQLYEVNPAFNVQVFSQTFFWISSELFNRIITRRKYLCRTKAVQIRMNITALEDWTRANGLPPHIASRHFVPIMQLLQWLQCSSQIKEFDMLIGTAQNLRSLNPLQMRRAVRDYRYEVNEGRMADDCNQYLLQLVRDWEQRRVHISVQQAEDSEAPTVASRDSHAMSIEALFDGSVSLAEWMPETGPEALGELLDSRHMLPFLIPQDIDYLLARPPADAAFSSLMTEKPPLPDGSILSRPLSVASYSSTRPMGWEAPMHKEISRLPVHFFAWMKQRQHVAQLTRDATRQREDKSRVRDDTTPGPPAVPPKAAARNSPEMAAVSTPPAPARESIELRQRSSNGSLANEGSPHYELGRHQRDGDSISSLSSVSSSPDKRRWWPQMAMPKQSPRVVSSASDDIPLQRLKDDVVPLGRLKSGVRQDSAETIRPRRSSKEMLA